MTLKVIGAGLGRTGTMSLQEALQILGYVPACGLPPWSLLSSLKLTRRRIGCGRTICAIWWQTQTRTLASGSGLWKLQIIQMSGTRYIHKQ